MRFQYSAMFDLKGGLAKIKLSVIAYVKHVATVLQQGSRKLQRELNFP